jgi:hypothetical protein
MSSHHFVKEGQEPALLIIDPIGLSVAEPLLEWSPLVIAHEKALEEVLLWGIKIDVVLAKNDHFEELKNRLQEQAPLKILGYDHNSDPLQTVLSFLMNLRQAALSILSHHPENLFDKLSPFMDEFTLTILSHDRKWIGIGSGSYKKWFPNGVELFLYGDSQLLKKEGLEASKQHYITKADGIVDLTNAGPFWVGEPL